MPIVRFVAPSGHVELEIAVPEGGRLLDVCDEQAVRIPFSCRGATCGTCRVEVLEGLDRLDPPGADEREVLASLGDGPARRLACQARIGAGPGLVVIRAVRRDG